NLAVQVDPGTYTVGEQYDIVHAAGGVSGTFAGETYNPLFANYLTPKITYGANDAYLNLDATPGAQGSPGLAYTSGASAVNNAYILNQSLLGAFSRIFSAHKGYWVQGLGGFGNAYGASVENYGGVLGDGAAINHHLVLGAAFSGMGTQTGNSYQQVNGRSFGFYGYGIYTQGALRISGVLGTGYQSYSEQRELHPTGLVASGSTQGWFFGSGAQAQYTIPLQDHAFLMPYLSANYLHTGTNAFNEQGAGLLNLNYGGQSTNLGVFTGGLRAGYALQGQGLTWTPWVEVGGTGYAGNRLSTTTETLGLLSTNMAAHVAPADSLDAGAGLTLQGKGPWNAKVGYVGQFSGANTQFNSFDLIADYRW
ncbi:autotransporter outer membrane beta-barrel domain-containing protein, partial [Acidithiobacillus sp.]